jgi:hypothetical protein
MAGLATAFALQAGCLSFVHPVDFPPREEVVETIQIPQACKNKVHIFFVHGLDPADLGNYSGLEEYVRKLGFIKTYYGMPYHAFHLEKELCKLRRNEPDARIVIVGFSYGAGLARDIACSVRSEGIDIDLLVYIDGARGEKRHLHRPANVMRVINILAFDRRDDRQVDEAENLRYADSWHFGSVTHPQTVRMLARELATVAHRVPIVQYAPLPTSAGPLPQPATLPPPQEIETPKDQWDFLKPDNHSLGVPGIKPAPQAFATDPATLGKPK